MSWFDLRNDGLRSLLVSLVFLVLTAVSSKLLDLGDVPHAIFSGVILLCTLFVVWIALAFGFRSLRAEWNADIDKLRAGNVLLQDKFEQLSRVFKADWLVPTSRVKEIEKHTDATEVWIITASLEEEIDSDQFLPIVTYNLERGITYRYFVPDLPLLRERGEVLKQTAQGRENLIIEYISHPLFYVVAMQDFGIFIPPERARTKAQAFMNLPIKERGLESFVSLGEGQTEILIAHLKEFMATRAKLNRIRKERT